MHKKNCKTKIIRSFLITLQLAVFISACSKNDSDGAGVAALPSKQCLDANAAHLDFEDVPQSDVAASVRAESHRGRRRYVKINSEQVRKVIGQASGKRIVINLFSDKAVEMDVDHVEKISDQNFVLTGKVSGTAMSSATLVLNQNVMQGHFQNDLTGEHYEISYQGSETHAIQEVQAEDLGDECLAEPAPNIDEDIEVDADPLGAPPVIDMLVAYTPAARAKKGGAAGIQSLIQMGIADTNRAFLKSGVNLSVRLVGMMEVSQNETGDYSSDLSKLRSSADGLWDSVHAERMRLGADQVTMIGVYANSGVAGIGYIGASSGYAFTIVKTSAFNQYTFSHELGHNVGLNHSDGLENLSGGFRTIMAYGSKPRIPQFSNPLFLYAGFVTGDSSHNSASILNSKGKVTASLYKVKVPATTTTTTMPPMGSGSTTTTTMPGGGEPPASGTTTTTLPSSTSPGSKPAECVN